MRKTIRQRASWSLRTWLDDKLSLMPALWTKAAGTKLRQVKSDA